MFEVGDIITGLPNNGYAITTDKAIMEVISVVDYDGDDIRVRVVYSITHQRDIGNTFYVESSKFKKAELSCELV